MIKRITKAALLAASLLLPAMPSQAFYAQTAAQYTAAQMQREANKRQAEEQQKEDELKASDWTKEFEETDPDDALEQLKTASTVSSAVLNLNTDTLYLSMEDKDGNKNLYAVKDRTDQVLGYLTATGVEVTRTAFDENGEQKAEKEATGMQAWGLTVSLLFVIGIPALCVFSNMRRQKRIMAMAGGDAKKPDAGPEAPKVRFSDVEGVEELKNDIFRLVDCLKEPDKYRALGARTPKGVILYGPPGTGKTLLAKAIAGEAGVPFFSAVGSDFVEVYVGKGASRVRDLYKKAKKHAPCIVFIDEVDAVAGKRGGTENNSERDQTVNALLAELDGFDGTKKPVITVCATNRLDMLDDAFKRAGRFDLKLAVGLPDKKARLNILKLHARNKKLADDISLNDIAARTSGFSGASLEALLNEAALQAAGKGQDFIRLSDIDDAFFKVLMQGNKKRREGISDTNRVVAWHEAGHTLATYLFTDDAVTTVTIIGSTSGAGGVTIREPKEESILTSKKQLLGQIRAMYAGRAAEELYLKDQEKITTGASQDIRQATSLIREYLAAYGFGENGMLDLSQFSREQAGLIEEAAEMAKKEYRETLGGLKKHVKALGDLSNTLLDKESLDRVEIEEILVKHGILPETPDTERTEKK